MSEVPSRYGEGEDAPMKAWTARPARDRLVLIVVVGLTLVGLVLRVYCLGDSGLWRDEAQAVFISDKAFPFGIIDALRNDGHPCLYYFIMHFWVLLFGRGEWSVRLLPALCGALTVPLVFHLGRRLFDVKTALVATFVAALLPLHVLYSRTGRMYSLVPLLSTLSMLLLWRIWTKGDRLSWAGWTAVSVLLVYTHNWGVLFIVAENLWMGFEMLRERRFQDLWWRWLVAQAVVVLLYLPWVPIFLQQSRQLVIMGEWLQHISKSDNVLRLFNELTSLYWPRDRVYPWVLLFALGTLALTLQKEEFGARYRFGPALDMAVACNFVPIVLGVLLTPRAVGVIPSYVTLIMYPALCLIMARGLRAVPRKLGVTLGVLAVVALWSKPLTGVYGGPISSLKEVAARVEAEAGEGDVIIIAPDYMATTFNYYYHGKQAQAAFPASLDRIEEIVWAHYSRRWEDAAEAIEPTLAFAEEQLGDGGRIWLLAPLEAYPGRYEFDQIRVLKERLDARYSLLYSDLSYRYAVENVDIYAYESK
jgi:mannosyltransferase